MEKIALKNRKI